jgi:hypothetical protein
MSKPGHPTTPSADDEGRATADPNTSSKSPEFFFEELIRLQREDNRETRDLLTAFLSLATGARPFIGPPAGTTTPASPFHTTGHWGGLPSPDLCATPPPAASFVAPLSTAPPPPPIQPPHGVFNPPTAASQWGACPLPIRHNERYNFPTFSGDEPQEWLFNVDMYFQHYGVYADQQ